MYFQSLHAYYCLRFVTKLTYNANCKIKILLLYIIHSQSLLFNLCRNQLASDNTDNADYGQLSLLVILWAHDNHVVIIYINIFRLDKHLVDLEKKHCIPCRWLPSDEVYKECELSILFSKREQLILQIWKASQRRMFLLKLKKRYAGLCVIYVSIIVEYYNYHYYNNIDGQKIAKKLCSQVSKETKVIKCLLEEYHACQSVCDDSSDIISLSEALDPLSIRVRVESFNALATTGDRNKEEAIQSYLILCRSKEEINFLKDDALNVIRYYERKKQVVYDKIAHLSTRIDSFSRGSIALLHLLLMDVDNLLKQGQSTLQTMVSMISEQTPCPFIDDDDDDEYSSECSDDDDDCL